jgi:hypothetical protein
MHRSLPIEAELSSPTKRFSFAGLEFQVCQSGQSSSRGDVESNSWTDVESICPEGTK